MHPSGSQSLTDHAQGLGRLARALVGASPAADDLVQETWLLALRKGRAGERGWLRGVLRNKHREDRRSAARRVRREAHARLPTAAPDPQATASRIEQQRLLTEALARVPEPSRTALWLRYFAGQSPALVARAMGVPASTSRSHVHRGLVALRAELEREHGVRSTWRLALLPWLASPTTASTSLGALMTLAKSKAAAAALVVLLVATGTGVLLHLRAEDPPPPRAADPVAGRPLDAAPPAPPPTLLGAAQPEIAEGAPASATDPAPDRAGTVRVHGRVRTETGEAIEPVTVYVVAKDAPPEAAPAGEQACSPEGAFDLRVKDVAGHWIAAAGPAGQGWLRAFVDGDTWDRGPLSLVLRRAPERTIRVVGPDGAGRTSRLLILAEQPSDVRNWPRPGDEDLGMWTRSTDEQGIARLRLPTERAFVVRARTPGHVALPRRVAPEETDIVIRLQPTALVRVTVTGWHEGDHPLTGRLERMDLEHDAAPIVVGARADATIVFDDGVAPGRYTLRVHSPEHDTAVLENVQVSHPGETVDVTLGVRPAEVGTLRVHVHAPGGPLEGTSRIQVLWRAHDQVDPDWRNRGTQPLVEDDVVLGGLGGHAHDVFVARGGEQPLAGVLHGAWARAKETERVRLTLRPASMRRMPDLGDAVVRGWSLIDEHGASLPLYFVSPHGSQCYTGLDLPPAGTRLGPYPEGAVTLRVEGPSGLTHEFPLAP